MTFVKYSAEVNALKGQRNHSPGQSEATPWVILYGNDLRPVRAKALPSDERASLC